MKRRRRKDGDIRPQPYRQILLLGGLTLLAVLAIALVSPQTFYQIKAWQESITAFFVATPVP